MKRAAALIAVLLALLLAACGGQSGGQTDTTAGAGTDLPAEVPAGDEPESGDEPAATNGETSKEESERAPSRAELGYEIPMLGAPDAPIIVTAFADFRCPHCANFVNEVKPHLQEQYIDTGIMRFGFFNLPILGPESLNAAIAATCAHEQDQFWTFHDRVYQVSYEEGTEAIDSERVQAIASELNLDQAQFAACVDEARYLAAIEADIQLARDIDVRSTPTFVINGAVVRGNRPIELWDQLIALILDSQESGESEDEA